ncbi:MAG: hypothetical protein HYW95_03170 [Candidatus Wildermuthbacteria bacterium]|nr:hypothetical protein [Candidatus Wildermuthbacteria bacterium]
MNASRQSKSNLLIEGLETIGIEYLAYLPCSTACDVLEHFRKDKKVTMIPLTKEEEGIGVMAGLEACGKKAVLLIQDSGLGNFLNALVTLGTSYKIPICIVATRRGGFYEINEANAEFGEIAPELIDASRSMGFILDYKVPLEHWKDVVANTYQYAHMMHKPIILLINLKQ